jgi:hypothetical protein
MAHHVGRTSITEQTDGRAMDAQPKPNRRLVPGHLTAAEHVRSTVPRASSTRWRAARGAWAWASWPKARARPGTVHSLLQALQAHGYVEQGRNSGKYQPGARLLQLGTSYLDLNELRARSLARRAARRPSRCRRARRCDAMARA